MKGLGNDNQIVYVQVNKQQISKSISYFDAVKMFGITVFSEGFYRNINNRSSSLVKIESIPNNFFVNDKIMFEKANIVIEYSNGRKEKIYFNSDNDMDIYLKREFQGRWWRVIE